MSTTTTSETDEGGWESAEILLDQEEEKIGGLERAQTASIWADILLRAFMAIVVAGIFILLNWKVMSFLRDAFDHDVATKVAASDRLVTTELLMTLIGATVVQTGVGVIAILSYLFPKRGG